jgi:hypothetical protein
MAKYPAVLTGVLSVNIEGGTPEHPIVEPPYPSQGPGFPTHPIAPGGPPPGIWPSPGHPAHPIVLPPGPVDPGYGIPLPPVISHPIPPTPEHPIALPPTYPVDPDYGLPLPPTVWPEPPKPVDPDYSVPVPILPTHPIYLPAGPNHDLPLPPGAIYPPLPPYVSTGPVGQLMCFVWIPGVGYRWTTIDVNLKPEHPIVIPPSTVPPKPTHPIAGSEEPEGPTVTPHA